MLRKRVCFSGTSSRLLKNKIQKCMFSLTRLLRTRSPSPRTKYMRGMLLISVAVLYAFQSTSNAYNLFTKPALVVFLLDTSASVRSYEAYRRAWHTVIQNAEDGDVIILAAVKKDASGDSSGEFPYLKTWTLPSYSVFERIDIYRESKKAAINEMKEAFDLALPRDRPNKTLLLSSLRSIAKHFALRQGPRILILASDGLEDSDAAKFATLTLTDRMTEKLISHEPTNQLREYMKGVTVHMISGGSPSDQKSMELENFWFAYFQAMGGYFPKHHYAGELLDYRRR